MNSSTGHPLDSRTLGRRRCPTAVLLTAHQLRSDVFGVVRARAHPFGAGRKPGGTTRAGSSGEPSANQTLSRFGQQPTGSASMFPPLLGWSHYLIEAAREIWSIRSPERQIPAAVRAFDQEQRPVAGVGLGHRPRSRSYRRCSSTGKARGPTHGPIGDAPPQHRGAHGDLLAKNGLTEIVEAKTMTSQVSNSLTLRLLAESFTKLYNSSTGFRVAIATHVLVEQFTSSLMNCSTTHLLYS